MRFKRMIPAMFFIGTSLMAVCEDRAFQERRQRAAVAFHDGILILHANSELQVTADGFRQDPFFYYFTGLENTVGAILAIDGGSGQSWLFLPSKPAMSRAGLEPEVQPGPEAEKRLGVDHVVSWSELDGFLATHSTQAPSLHYAGSYLNLPDLPANLLSAKSPGAPAWLQIILQRWPTYEAKESGDAIQGLMAVQSPEEMAALRSAAKATVAAVLAGIRAIRPGVSQRSVEAAIEDTCWKAGAHGSSFWPWAMSGETAVFPRPFTSFALYDHLNRTMRPGELVRLDVGCEQEHYIGDLGRTVPVSGHFDEEQRETWRVFLDAHRAGARKLKDGVSIEQVFDAWREELLRHRESVKTAMARRAIDSWSDPKNVPYWQVHTTNLVPGSPVGPLKQGTTINFEPIASIDGQGFFLEDMYIITKDGSELLTPGVPYSADEIEAAMK